MEFWGLKVKAGASVKVKPDQNCVIHIYQALLDKAEEVDKGEEGESAFLFVTVDGQKFAIGFLSQNIPRISLTFFFGNGKEFELSHTLKSGSVHFIGYKSPNIDDQEEEDYSSGNLGAPVINPDSDEKVEPSNKKRANESASITPGSSKKAKPEAAASPLKRTGKSVLVPCSKSKSNLKKQEIHKEISEEIKEMKKSIKELSEAMKKLQEIQTTKPYQLEVSLKEKETPKKNEDTCCFECEDAKGNDYQTIFVKGFERVRPRDEIKNALSSVFGSCGKITRVFVPMECKTRVPLGFAFINFSNGEDKEKALQLNGSYMGGRKLKVTMARHRDEYDGFTDFNGCDRCPIF